MRAPEIEILWWEGCPSTERALNELRAAIGEVGLEDAEIRMREIRTDADADEAGFKGSPTILIDGADVLAAAPTAAGAPAAAPVAEAEPAPEAVGLNCRVYRRRDGRISPTPDPDDVRDALRLAAGAEVNR